MAGINSMKKGEMMLWHSVLSASEIRVLYSPQYKVVMLLFAKHATIRLIESSASYDLVVSASMYPPNSPPLLKPKLARASKPSGLFLRAEDLFGVLLHSEDSEGL